MISWEAHAWFVIPVSNLAVCFHGSKLSFLERALAGCVTERETLARLLVLPQ